MKQPDPLSQDDVLLNRLTQTILDNLGNEQFGVETLAEAVGISRSHLHRKLKKLKGQSISQFIRDIRLEEAYKLLIADAGNISEIAYQVGFNTPSYFHKCFVDRYGYSPSEARNQQDLHPAGDISAGVEQVEIPMDSGTGVRWPFLLGAALFCVMIAVLTYWVISPGVTDKSRLEQSIAVLPFTNLSSEAENQYFADGLVEDLLNRLSIVRQFKVISRTSSDTYRERGAKTVPQIASELGVAYIVEGSVQRSGNKVRITIQLIDAKRDHHQWSQSFDRELGDIFVTQSEIAMRVASELQAVLTREEKEGMQKNGTENLRAFELYQLGRFSCAKRTDEDCSKSINYYEQAIAEDPDYGLAYAGLADTYHIMAIWEWIEKKEGRDKAVAAATQALELDPTLIEAHTVLASVFTFLDWNWPAAEAAYLRAIELNPNYATAHQYYAEHLSIIGREAEARMQIDKALELDPLSFIIRLISTQMYMSSGQLEAALAENEICLELNRHHVSSIFNGFLLNQQAGNNDQALVFLQDWGRVAFQVDPTAVAAIYDSIGFEGLWKWKSELPEKLYDRAVSLSMGGEDEAALDLLERAFELGIPQTHFTYTFPFKHLHSHPRFEELLSRIGLPWAPADSL